MSKSSPDLLQALLDRQRAEKSEPVPTAPASSAQPSSAAPSKAETPATAPAPAAAPLPVVELKPKAAPVTIASTPRGMTITFPMFVTAVVVIGAAIAGSFLLGRWSAVPSNGSNVSESTPATSGNAPATSKTNIPSPPSSRPFEWGKKFTVEAASSGSSKGELDRLVDLSKYLGKLGVAASPFEVKESGKSVGAIFLGGADSANDTSLVKLRDWVRAIPGPDGTGRPFQSARIRPTPKQEKK